MKRMADTKVLARFLSHVAVKLTKPVQRLTSSSITMLMVFPTVK